MGLAKGGTQGDPKTGDEFCVTIQPSLVKLDTEGFAIAGADDIFPVEPRGAVLSSSGLCGRSYSTLHCATLRCA